MRTPIVAGNWKMNMTVAPAVALAEALAPPAAARPDVEVVLCPPFTALAAVAAAIRGNGLLLGAQDLFWKENGAYTGEVSPPMLVDLGCRYVIVGHSERRGRFGVPDPDMPPDALAALAENDVVVNLKARAALAHDLAPIVCVGETLAERREDRTDAVIGRQLERGLAGISTEEAARLVLAYEPVWAIGTGEVCPAAEAERVCDFIRKQLAAHFDAATAERVRIQYGGSVKPENAAELLAQPAIDGALVGGASLKAVDFGAIIAAA
jgi:triosephosphate isomerase